MSSEEANKRMANTEKNRMVRFRTRRWVLCGLGCLVVVVALVVPLRPRRDRSHDHAAVARAMQCLDQAKRIEVRVHGGPNNGGYTVRYESRAGQPAFERAMAMLRAAVVDGEAGGGGFKYFFGSATLIGNDGKPCGQIELYHGWTTIAGERFKLGGSELINVFGEAYTQETYFYPSGARRASGEHSRGEKHGKWTYFYESGGKMAEGEYIFGKKTGPWRQWDETAEQR